MRTLPLFLVLLLATLALAASAHALPSAATARFASAPEAALDEGADDEGEEGEEGEGCEVEAEDEEEAESCGEAGEGEEEGEECVIESATADVFANPTSGRVRIVIRYETTTPSTVNLDYGLRGGKGTLHLGTARAQFHRSGVFHDALSVGAAKLSAARQFVIELQASGTSDSCRERLTVQAPRRAGNRHRAGNHRP